MDIRVIKNDTEYQSMLEKAEHLVSLDPTPGSKEAEKLELLAVLIEDFEKRHFPFDSPDPIDAIEYRMMEQGLRQIDLAPMLGSRSRVSEILSRKRPLSVQMIRSLSKGLGIPLEILFSEQSKKKTLVTDIEHSALDWTKFPVKEMVSRGWLSLETATAKTEAARKAAEASLKTFLKQVYTDIAAPALFRRTFRGDVLDEKSYYSTLAWSSRVLARAKASSYKYENFNPASLDEDFFVHVARLSSNSDGPRNVVKVLADKGIALVIEPKLPNTLLDGATLLTEGGLPVIGMTLRYDRVDYFWFTLLHELAHVWKHINSADEAFIDRVENNSPVSLIEKQANRIARDALIPRAIWKRSAAFMNQSRQGILQLAGDLSIHPAIVVGRLQKEIERYDIFRDLLGQDSIRPQFPEASF
jgi:HTH-type transcriptional regulator / antitoxin HigA